MARLSRIVVYPVKSLGGCDLETVPVVAGGRTAYDREYAMFDAKGDYVNGRSNDRVFALDSTFDVDGYTLGLEAPDGRSGRFHVDEEREALEAWLSAYFDEPIEFRQAIDRNFCDSTGGLARRTLGAAGPTIVSDATVDRVASWFDGLDPEDIRRRFRYNLEIEGVEAFWEDRLAADGDSVVEFSIGDVRLFGVMHKPRCRVPVMDPDAAERYEDFVRTFVERRETEFPSWADPAHLGQQIELDTEHYYYLTVVSRIPRTEEGKSISVGDEIEIYGTKSVRQVL